MNSLYRLIRVLDCFEQEPGIFTAEQLFAKLGYTRSTTYRYLKVLSDSGLLTSWHGSGYSLGPRIVELHAFMMARDPLLLISKPEMQTVCKAVPGVVVLCRRFKDKLLGVHAESSAADLKYDAQIGRAQALVGSAAARVVLSRYGTQQLRKFYDSNAEAIVTSGMSSSLIELRSKLKLIRDMGYDFDRDESEDGLTSIASVLTDPSGSPVGSLNLAIASKTAPQESVSTIARHIVDASQNIFRAMAH